MSLSDTTVNHKDVHSLAATHSCSRPKATNRSAFNLSATDMAFLFLTFMSCFEWKQESVSHDTMRSWQTETLLVMIQMDTEITCTGYNENLVDCNLTPRAIWSDECSFELHSSLILCKKLDKIGQVYERIKYNSFLRDCCLSAGLMNQESLTHCSVKSQYWSTCKVYIIGHDLK